jgi:hypothetical protein
VTDDAWQTWALVLSGPSLWFCVFCSSYALTTEGCTAQHRTWLLAMNGAVFVLCAVLGLFALWRRRRSQGTAGFLALSSIGLQAFCALLALGQLLPLLMRVSCD